MCAFFCLTGLDTFLMIAIKKLILSLLLLLLTACTTIISGQQQILVEEEASGFGVEKAWYAVRFSIPWDKAVDPDWYVGTLIAGEVISPVLEQNQKKIVCWRIHRRAVDDKIGHEFSFIFYSSQVDAAIIYRQFKNNKLLADLHSQRVILKVAYDPLHDNTQTNIADTSDPVWPEEIRRSWPYFITGASQMWLEQIKGFKKELLDEQEIKLGYREIQHKMTELWQQQGQHALVHHLSALYAYEPVLTRF